MKIGCGFNDLDQLLRKFGLAPVPFRLPSQLRLPPPGKPTFFEGVVDLDALQRGKDGTFIGPEGGSVFLYINRFQTDYATAEEAVAYPVKLKRFHVMECKKIREMRSENRFERYVYTDCDEGPFNVTLVSQGKKAQKIGAHLHVCKNCLHAINWKGYRGERIEGRDIIVETFSREEFLQEYSPSFVSRPSKNGNTTTIVDYPLDWSEISRNFRASRGYRCETQNCGVDCTSQPGLTDAHHINHDVTDCRPENLQVLCKLCHEQRHRGWYRVRDRARRDILELRRLQRIKV